MDLQTTKHEIVIGRKQNGELTNALATGQAFLREGDNYYTVKLMMFPGQTYYLVKNKDSHDRYTVFAKQVKTEDTMKFQNPVGSGRLSLELSSHLEIYFPVIRSQMFMCLFPSGV
jgi:hypothetical protein